jgi:four helix bundle protein
MRDFEVECRFRKITYKSKFELRKRTKTFHVNVINLCMKFPGNVAGFETAKELIRAAGSVGANYRTACPGKIAKSLNSKIRNN